MLRRRHIAASPVRKAAATWTAITDLAAVTFERSDAIHEADVRELFEAIAPAGCALVAGGHLDRCPLTLVAPPLHLEIGTVSGEQAFRTLDAENVNPVPGAATSVAWMLYVPCPDGLAALIDQVILGHVHVSTDDPPPPERTNSAATSAEIDLSRLDPAHRN
jgi:hypothetical protein